MLAPYGLEQLQSYYDDGIEADTIIFAMQKAVDSNKRSMNYIKAILNDWYKKGIKKLVEAKNEQENYLKSRQPKEETEEEKIARKTKELEESMRNGNI